MYPKFEYSKLIIIFETILIAILTIGILSLVWYSISLEFDGAFPYLTTMVSVAWAAYGTSTGFYYNKAKTENKIKLMNMGADKDIVMSEPYINNTKEDIDYSSSNDNIDNIDINDLLDKNNDDEVLG